MKKYFPTIDYSKKVPISAFYDMYFIFQNPPTIPTLAITWLVCGLKGSSFVIDWHNYGYSILAMNLKSQINPLVKFATW